MLLRLFSWFFDIDPQLFALGGRTRAAAAASAPALPICQSSEPSTTVSVAARQSLCATGVTAPCCAGAATSVGSTVRAALSPLVFLSAGLGGRTSAAVPAVSSAVAPGPSSAVPPAAAATALVCAAAPAAPPGADSRTTLSAVSTVPPVGANVDSFGAPPSAAPPAVAAAAASRAILEQ